MSHDTLNNRLCFMCVSWFIMLHRLCKSHMSRLEVIEIQGLELCRLFGNLIAFLLRFCRLSNASTFI